MADMRETQARADQRGEGQAIQPRETGCRSPETTRSLCRSGGGPFSLMRRMQEDMDRLFGDVWGRRGWPTLFTDERRAEFAPAIEAFQRGNDSSFERMCQGSRGKISPSRLVTTS